MAILYKANETTFNHLGLGVLNDAVSIFVTEERNGIFELEMEYPVSGSSFADLKLDRLIKADAGHNLKNQRFKIIRITKPMNGIVKIYGEHVSYLAQDLSLSPTVSYSGSAGAALSIWENAIIGVTENPFTTYSDITTTGSGTWSIKDVKNARQALGGVKGSLLDTYGGEYMFDNYDIKLYANRGKQSGALIAYGRNLTDLEQEESIADTYTSIYPYAVVSDGSQNETILTLPEYYIDSEYVGNYARRKILTVDFSGDDVTSVEQLRAKAEAYIVNNRIGVPKVNLKIKYVDLAKTLDYEATQALEEVNICDWVTVYFEEYGIKTNEKIIKTVWDDLLKQYDSIEVGEARASLSKSINATFDGKLETVTVNLNTVRLAADGKTKIYTGTAEPVASNVNDLWYKPVASGAVEMYRWDGVIWALQKTSADALAGTVDFATVQAINIDANAITTGTLSGVNMWLNLNTGEMQFTDPLSGDILVFDQGKIMFENNGTIRYLKYSEEGFIFEPGTGNVGTARNTSLILRGGSAGSYKYIDFMDKDPDTGVLFNKQRITARNAIMYMETIDRVHVIHKEDLSFAPIAASGFEVSSSEEYKQNILSTDISALDKINTLDVVEYDLNHDVANSIENKQLGFIAENSPYIAGSDGKSIDLYKAIALNTKAIQELYTEKEMFKQELADLKKLLTDKGVIA